MKFNILSYTSLFLVIVMFFLPLTFAPWSIIRPPLPPQDGLPRTCTQWICYHGFTIDNYGANREMSLIRDFKLDKYASTWAAIYAFAIGGIGPSREVLPQEFCDYYGAGNNVFSYNEIQNGTGTCEDWILLYGFIAGNKHQNLIFAKNQHFIKNYEISLWADNYTNYLSRCELNSDLLTPKQFCSVIGKSVDPEATLMPFMSQRDTKLTCEAWIKLYDFTDELNFNIMKAQIKIKPKISVHIHYWANNYARYLRDMNVDYIIKEAITPKKFCSSINIDGEFVEYTFYYPMKKLEEFNYFK